MSSPTKGVSAKNDSSLENVRFYARVDTTSSGRNYFIMKKGNGDQLSPMQKMWKAIMEFFSIDSKTTYIEDEHLIEPSVANDLTVYYKQSDDYKTLKKEVRKKTKLTIFTPHLWITGLNKAEKTKFQRMTPSSHIFANWKNVNERKHKIDKEIDNDHLD